jgi:para-aminobenzoate synthetase component 1
MLALLSADERPDRSRWSIIAECPGSAWAKPSGSGAGGDGSADAWAEGLPSWPGEAATQAMGHPDPELPPFVGGFVGMMGYELGEWIEPRVAGAERGRAGGGAGEAGQSRGGIDDDRTGQDWPSQLWYRIDAAMVFDHLRARWWCVGDAMARRALAAIARGAGAQGRAASPAPELAAARFRLRPVAPEVLESARALYTRNVARVLEHIGRGDAYQVNLAHALDFGFEGDARSLFAALCDGARPRMGALLPLPDDVRDGAARRRCVVSASPEVFATITPAPDGSGQRVISTVPMKGTRASDADALGAMDDLLTSGKDRAELTMIVDLMRNDLGRVCEPGSVRVRSLREIERHGRPSAGVLQATSTIEGQLRADASLAEIVRAIFPPGSVTGAPKIRAMQIIRSLESGPRGPYCGAIGYLSDCGHGALSVAIRTACISGEPRTDSAMAFQSAVARWWVGAGIVAQSEPEAEWRETIVKAHAILGLARG